MSGNQQPKQEVTQGSLVRFSSLASWQGTYGNGPFLIGSVQQGHGGKRYVSLKDMQGKRLPLGGGEGLINIGFVEPWRP